MWALVAVLSLHTSPVSVLQTWRQARLAALSTSLNRNFGSAALPRVTRSPARVHGGGALASHYQVCALMVDSGDGTAQICAALLNRVADSVGVHLQLRATSLEPVQRPLRAGGLGALQLASARGRFAVEATELRAVDLRSGGPYDLVLTTEIELLDHVRAMMPAEEHAPPLEAFCLTDFAFGGDESDASAAVAALLALPAPLRRIVAAHPGGLGSRIDLPRAASGDWDDYLALTTACALGFTTHLKQSVSAHARNMLMSELVESHPTVQSLSRAHLAAYVQEGLPGGVSVGERRRIIEAYVLYLRKKAGA